MRIKILNKIQVLSLAFRISYSRVRETERERERRGNRRKLVHAFGKIFT